VRAVDPTATGPLSNADLATTMFFTDDHIVTGSTLVKAVHITELRAAVTAVRAAAGLPPVAYSDPSLGAGYAIRRAHIIELRTGLDEARANLGVSTLFYTEYSLPPGTRVKAVHIRELRAGVQ